MARSVSASPGAIDSETGGAPEPDGDEALEDERGERAVRPGTDGERATGRDVASAPPRRSAATSPVVVAATGVSRRVFPRERSVRRSAPSKTSARRCVMRRTARPASVRRRRARKRAAVSSGERTAVGSSRMRTSGSVWSAPAMPIRWRVPTGSSSTRASGLPRSRPDERARRSTRSRRAREDSKTGAKGSRRARLSATVAASTRRSCCGTRAIPARRAARGSENDDGAPSRRISPASG